MPPTTDSALDPVEDANVAVATFVSVTVCEWRILRLTSVAGGVFTEGIEHIFEYGGDP
ncbi:hypothetical protein JDV09_13290 [Mycobacterium sp. Y57]|uniref:hypothetical protein n=1 Tax=Mycolicibacterium xanthum TaxID=2796469 RepID=UPI001C8448A1|nr:hypothetical protein [Mycolicibacterium xanthum]MBX7433075.1 hypothetical protein [Mycolicibacterium xanthum]